MDVNLRILRYDPESSKPTASMTPAAGLPAAGEADSTPIPAPPKPHWVEYKVSVDPMDRVLDLLIKVKAEQDGSLSFRRSCGHGICGSDAMMINGRNRLACRIRVDQLGKKISVAPLPGLPVVKDLIVEMSGFFGKYRSVKPYLINEQPEPERERRQSPADRAVYDDTTKCILCAACTSSCPSFWARPEYVGPAAIVQAHRFIFDSRDEGSGERLEILADENGVWRCRTIFNCVDACPRGINITRAILEVSSAIVGRRG
ncbi:MAG: succinate dehydrogenase iron-sulfur subunit [Candidatus Limnocylindrales bacterium]|jgi:succinate dehydrogenase / fumarate reductase iron-sulfur subunit